MAKSVNEKLGLFSATLIGVGAIIGGGIFVLGGIAISNSGALAALAFLLNGVLVALTIQSISRVSKYFPESGGAYLYAKRIISVRAAFVIGWMLWLAHIVAALLYALGFSTYFVSVLNFLYPNSISETFLPWVIDILAIVASAIYTIIALKSMRSDGKIINVLKLVVFFGLIAVSLFYSFETPFEKFKASFDVLMPNGLTGLFAAMGFTFIALQGFELIAASSGDINQPEKTVPKAMYLSLIIALILYIPLMLFAVGLGIPEGAKASVWCENRVETCMADAFSNFLGTKGYLTISIIAMAGMLSALQANIVAAARTVLVMAEDRTLPRMLANRHEKYDTPETSILFNFSFLFILLIAVPDVATAGSTASLAFLICFTFLHVLCFLTVKRKSERENEAYAIKVIPTILAAIACFSLVIFQLSVEITGAKLLLLWIGFGSVIYYTFLSRRAETLDAFSQATNPSLFSFRGPTPALLIPIANPDNVPSLVSLAIIMAPAKRNRLLLLSVAESRTEEAVKHASSIISSALNLSLEQERSQIEGIVSIERDKWRGISNAAKVYNCETLILGLNADFKLPEGKINLLFQNAYTNVMIVSSPPGWNLESVKKVLVPIAGQGQHDLLRARSLGGLINFGVRDITFLRLLSPSASESSIERVRRWLEDKVIDETEGLGKAMIGISDSFDEEILKHSDSETLIILGLKGEGAGSESLGPVVKNVIKNNQGATLIIRHSV